MLHGFVGIPQPRDPHRTGAAKQYADPTLDRFRSCEPESDRATYERDSTDTTGAKEMSGTET